MESVAEAIQIGERAGLPFEVFHLKAAYQPGWGSLMREVGKLIDVARARNVDVAADLYLYTAGGSFMSTEVSL
jgi:N-acyl-D-amino-acid deacylase